VKDGKADTFWASDGNGENGSITLEADQVFAITSIELKDLPSSNHCRFKKARVVFPELSPAKSFDFLEKSSATLTTTLDLPEEIKAKKMQIEFLSGGIVAGSGSNKNCGFSEIAVTGSYTPP
jgi:hypothetical protein